MSDLMVRHHTLPELYHEVAVGLRKVADFQFLNLSLYHPEHNAMQLHFLEGEPASGLPKELPLLEAPGGWVWQHQQELMVENLEKEGRFPRVLQVLRSKGIQDLLCAATYQWRQATGRARSGERQKQCISRARSTIITPGCRVGCIGNRKRVHARGAAGREGPLTGAGRNQSYPSFTPGSTGSSAP